MSDDWAVTDSSNIFSEFISPNEIYEYIAEYAKKRMMLQTEYHVIIDYADYLKYVKPSQLKIIDDPQVPEQIKNIVKQLTGCRFI